METKLIYSIGIVLIAIILYGLIIWIRKIKLVKIFEIGDIVRDIHKKYFIILELSNMNKLDYALCIDEQGDKEFIPFNNLKYINPKPKLSDKVIYKWDTYTIEDIGNFDLIITKYNKELKIKNYKCTIL